MNTEAPLPPVGPPKQPKKPAPARKPPAFDTKVTIERANTGNGETIRTIKDVPACKVEQQGKPNKPVWFLKRLEAKLPPNKGDRIIASDGSVWVVDNTIGPLADGRFLVNSTKKP